MTDEQDGPTATSFDLTVVRGQLEPILKGRRRTSLAMVVFALVLAVALAAASVRPLESHSLGTTALIALVILLGSLVCGAALLSPTRANLKPGAVRLELDSEGFTLIYSEGRVSRNAWKDPSLKFDLIDTSSIGRSVRQVDTPYSIQVDGVRSLLPPTAYLALARVVEERGLLRKESSGSGLLYGTGASPRVTRVSQGSTSSIRL